LSSNQVVQLATDTLRALQTCGQPVDYTLPEAQFAGVRHGQQIPFWDVYFRNPTNHMAKAANVEIDGRTGAVVCINLYDDGFFDSGFEQQISKRVYTADAPRPKAKRLISKPTPDQLALAIEHWRIFCQGLGIAIPPNTSLADVDWERSLVCTDRVFSLTKPVCQVVFKNDVLFDSLDGLVYDYYSRGSFFVGDFLKKPKSEREALQGEVTKNWKDLARDFQVRLSTYIGPLSSRLADAMPLVREAGGEHGSIGLTRTVIQWRKYEQTDHTVESSDLPLLFLVEFDLRTGEVMWVHFCDATLLGSKELRPPIKGL
jgi:hypothetical protein